MASASKTPSLNLPQWVGTEKPERTDFNAAFDAIDTTVASHLAEDVSQGNPHGIDAKANKVQENWTAAALLNGWVNFGGTDPTAGFYKDELGIVHLKGQIKSGQITDGTILFTLPTGYRTAENLQFPAFHKSPISIGTLVVFGANVQIFDISSNVALYLNGISFRADS